MITGWKPPGTGVWVNGAAAIAIGVSSAWSYNAPLAIGDNRLEFVARDGAGNRSPAAAITIRRLAAVPSFTVDPAASPTNAASTLLSGSASPDTTVEINGSAIGYVSGGRWTAVLPLAEGLNTFSVVGRAGGMAGSPIVVAVLRDSIPPRPPTNVRSTPPRAACVVADSVQVEWDAATDDGSGVVGYRYSWDASPDGDAAGGASTALGALHASLGPGRWYLHVAAVDGAGNVSTARHYGPICLLTRGGMIAGTVFADLDGDGRFGEEPGMGGWHAEARSAEARLEATTAADGSYWMEGPPGWYTVCVRPPSRSRGQWTAGPGLAEEGGAFCRPVEAMAGVQMTWRDFGFYQPAKVKGTVFSDPNRDGFRDSDEPGLGDVAVRALDGRGRSVETISGADGAYALALNPGEYLLCASPPSGMAATSRTPDGGCVAIAVRSGHDVDAPAFGVGPP